MTAVTYDELRLKAKEKYQLPIIFGCENHTEVCVWQNNDTEPDHMLIDLLNGFRYAYVASPNFDEDNTALKGFYNITVDDGTLIYCSTVQCSKEEDPPHLIVVLLEPFGKDIILWIMIILYFLSYRFRSNNKGCK